MSNNDAGALPLQRLYHWERTRADAIWLTQPAGGGQLRELTWRQGADEVRGMAAYGFEARGRGLGWATGSFPLPSFNSFIILLGTILVVVGFGFPNMAPTVGLGFAMIALAIGLRVFLRRPQA